MNVRFVFVLKATAAAALNVTVELPRLIVRVLLLLDDRPVAVTSLLLVVKVPWVTVIAPEDVSGSPSVTVIPDPFMVTGPSVFPALVSVPVPMNCMVPAPVAVMPTTSVRLPDKMIDAVKVKPPVNPVQVMDLAPVLPAAIVQVTAPELPSKNTSSADVGTAAPPAPPDVVAHFVPAVPSQEAVPPTQ